MTAPMMKKHSESKSYTPAHYQRWEVDGVGLSGQAPSIENSSVVELAPGHPAYPTALGSTGPTLYARGELSLLSRRLVGLFASLQANGQSILSALNWARSVSDDGTVVVSGFHTPLEQECLALFLMRKIPVIVCPAREIAIYRISSKWQDGVGERRLLLLSPFRAERRITAATCAHRNTLIVQLVSDAYVLYASEGGRVEAVAGQLTERGVKVRYLTKPKST